MNDQSGCDPINQFDGTIQSESVLFNLLCPTNTSLPPLDSKLSILFAALNYNYLSESETDQQTQNSDVYILYQVNNCLINKPVALVEGNISMVQQVQDSQTNNSYVSSDVILLPYKERNSFQKKDYDSFCNNKSDKFQLVINKECQVVLCGKLSNVHYYFDHQTNIHVFLKKLKIVTPTSQDEVNFEIKSADRSEAATIELKQGQVNLWLEDDAFGIVSFGDSMLDVQFLGQLTTFRPILKTVADHQNFTSTRWHKVNSSPPEVSNFSFISIEEDDDELKSKNKSKSSLAPTFIRFKSFRKVLSTSNYKYHSLVSSANEELKSIDDNLNKTELSDISSEFLFNSNIVCDKSKLSNESTSINKPKSHSHINTLQGEASTEKSCISIHSDQCSNHSKHSQVCIQKDRDSSKSNFTKHSQKEFIAKYNENFQNSSVTQEIKVKPAISAAKQEIDVSNDFIMKGEDGMKRIDDLCQVNNFIKCKAVIIVNKVNLNNFRSQCLSDEKKSCSEELFLNNQSAKIQTENFGSLKQIQSANNNATDEIVENLLPNLDKKSNNNISSKVVRDEEKILNNQIINGLENVEQNNIYRNKSKPNFLKQANSNNISEECAKNVSKDKIKAMLNASPNKSSLKVFKKAAIHDIQKSIQHLKMLDGYIVKNKKNLNADEKQVRHKFEKYRQKLREQLLKTINSIERYVNEITGDSRITTDESELKIDQSFFYDIVEKMMKLISSLEYDVFRVISKEINQCLVEINAKYFERKPSNLKY